MPGLCAVLCLDGRPAERSELDAALGCLLSPTEERRATWTSGAVGLAASAFAATDLAPPLAVEGELAVVVDARLDEPRSLAARLREFLRAEESAATPAELVLAAYRKWGVESLRELLGEFAFVLWDGARRRLFVARDALGVRQLVWAREGSRYLFATRVGALRALLGRTPEPHWPLLSAQLERNFDRWLDETCDAGVLRLPPAHFATVEAGGRWQSRRWAHLGEWGARGARTEEEHVEAFGAALAAAVRSRLAGGAPAGLLVSGGLDSSSLACLAARAAEDDPAIQARLYAMDFATTPGADESVYREAVFARCSRLPAVRVPSDDAWALKEFGADDGFPLDEPERELTRGLVARIVRRAVADGCVAILGGHWGDQVLGSGAYGAVTALGDVPASRIASELPYFRRHRRIPGALLAAYALVAPWGGDRLRRVLRGRRAETARARALLPPPPLPSASAELVYFDLTSGVTAASLASLDRLGRWLGIEWRLPYLDRRVVEAALALPPSLRFQGGVAKRVLRRALVGLVPDEILERRGRAYFDGLVERGLRSEERDRIRGLLDQPRVVASGLLSATTLESVRCSYFGRESEPASYRSLASLLCVEAWLRNHESPKQHRGAPVVQVRQTGGG